ncbi:MAG: glycoside hydrolase family 3 C-terminal domain-containing protein [Duncaniella sp.]|nr:glycoside hydrolase family 3 C-terminal domain-containing protein [Muribaculum sp.]MCM1255120.1 glycoside hydrolase family 3 C-terminal domain-containing protein [Duncaniella sp.]
MKKIIATLIVFAASASALTQVVSSRSISPEYPFQDITKSDNERIDNLISMLTLEEKIALLSTNLGVPRLGIPNCGQVEGLHGLSLSGPGKEKPDTIPTTIFPQAYGLGQTWDTDLIRRIASHVADEARYYSHRPDARYQMLVMRAPNADLGRDPRWGRTEECFGEDPHLTAAMTVAKIKGLQGDNPRYWKTAALMKHFLANSNEFGRDSTSSNFDSRLFREYYSYPFYKGITEGGSRAYMAAYNSWNGIPMSIHPCLDSITRQEWGNDGIICTDGGAFGLLITAHKRYTDRAEGAAAVVKAGIGQFLDRYKDEVNEALEKGWLTEKEIEYAIRGNLKVALKLGLLDSENSENPYAYIGRDTTEIAPFLTPYASVLAREATGKSIVLLKNEPAKSGNKLLPADPFNLKKIALIGPYANKIVQDWYSGLPPYEVTILDGIRNALKATDVEVVYAEDNRMGHAVEIAKDADLAMVCVGNHPYGTMRNWFFCPVPSDGREAVDRRSLQLPDEDLVREIYAANPNTVLLLVSNFPYTINWSAENIPAILHVTHCSQEQGNGVADVMLGKVNPAGRTTQTWVADILDLPPMMDYDITKGRTYMYFDKTPLFPFGHGLSYTNFQYSDLQANVNEEKLHVKFDVKNTGDRDGDEVPQLYVAIPEENLPYRLKAFDRINVKSGEKRTVEFDIPLSELGSWKEGTHDFTPSPKSTLRLAVGPSSANLSLMKDIAIEVEGLSGQR